MKVAPWKVRLALKRRGGVALPWRSSYVSLLHGASCVCEALSVSRGREVATGRFAVRRQGKGGEKLGFFFFFGGESAW